MDEFGSAAAHSLESQLHDLRAGHDGEIRAMDDRAQEGVGRAPAPAALLVHLEVGAAEVVAAVEDLDRRDAAFGRRLAPGIDDVPAHPRVLHPYLAVRAVAVHRAVLVVLEGFEYRQHLVPRPAAVA